jgi:flagella basal body P-ring formation protein FlgA
MRALRACAAAAVAIVPLLGPLSHAAGRSPGQAVPAVARIQADDPKSLQGSLIALAQDRLRPAGWFIDPQRTRLLFSGSLPTGTVEVRPTWSADSDPPPLPLTFELKPVRGSAAPGNAAGSRPMQVTLAVGLLREVWVAARRLPKGSVVTCDDLGLERRDVRLMPRPPLATPCELGPETVSLRDIGARDVVRTVDIGRAPDVTAGAPVRVTVATGGISVSTTAIALADARVGDRIEVRLQRPARILRTRVIGPGSVQLMDGS